MKILSPKASAVIVPKLKKKELAEIERCRADPVYFIRTYVQLRNPLNVGVQFNLYPHQEEFIKHLQQGESVISAQCRGSGSTSTAVAFMLWESIFHPNHETYITGAAHPQTMHMYDMFLYGRHSLPLFLRLAMPKCNTSLIEFDNGSKIHFQTINQYTFIGARPNRIFIDSFGYTSDSLQSTVLSSLSNIRIQQHSHGKHVTKLVINSTPTNKNNTYAHFWKAAEAGSMKAISTFKRTVHDVKNFNQHQLMTLGMIATDTFKREYECDFDA